MKIKVQAGFYIIILHATAARFAQAFFSAKSAKFTYDIAELKSPCLTKVEFETDSATHDPINQRAHAFPRFVEHADKFEISKFHHLEFYCGDAISTASRFMLALGMPMVSKTDLSTGNRDHASYVLQSDDVRFVFTAAYGRKDGSIRSSPWPWFRAEDVTDFLKQHGVGVKAIGIEVRDAREAYEVSVENGGDEYYIPRYSFICSIELVDSSGIGVSPPRAIGSGCVVSEVAAYGSVVLRFVSFSSEDEERKKFSFIPGFEEVDASKTSFKSISSYGIERIDHVVGNVWRMKETVDYIQNMTGMHRFAEFDADQVGTSESGLNSVVLASSDESVLLPINEPVYNMPRKSQIQTFLEQYCGEGVQHCALKTSDIIKTVSLMKESEAFGGFSFVDKPNAKYYRDLMERIPELEKEKIEKLSELGILADKDDQGILLQIFTKYCSDRPTFFIEIIQRIGCEETVVLSSGEAISVQRGGCGGFGKGNFRALFKSIEDAEKVLGL